jgi:hypothetical protein
VSSRRLTILKDLLEKLTAVEKRLAELELKSNGTPLTKEALAMKDKVDGMEVKSKSKTSNAGSEKVRGYFHNRAIPREVFH